MRASCPWQRLGYPSGRLPAAEPDWPSYLARFHDDQPGITERVLDRALDDFDAGPYAWLAAPLDGDDGVVVDLACGSAPTRPLLSQRRWLGVDTSARELALASARERGPLVMAKAAELPVPDGSVSAVCGAMCFPVLTPLHAVLVETRRILCPGGRIVALVPSNMVGPRRGMLAWLKLMCALGLRSQLWPNPGARDGLAKLLRSYGFVVESDERRVYRISVTNPDDAAEMVDSLYLPGVATERIRTAKRTLGAWSRPWRTLPLPLRRVVARLPDGGGA